MLDKDSIEYPVPFVPIENKLTMTIDEAVAYTGIGRDKLRVMTSQDDCPFVLWVGNRRLIKRKALEEYIERTYSV